MKTNKTDETDERPLTEDTGNPPLESASELPGGQEISQPEKFKWVPISWGAPVSPDTDSFGGG